jgi:hypothetical protein
MASKTGIRSSQFNRSDVDKVYATVESLNTVKNSKADLNGSKSQDFTVKNLVLEGTLTYNLNGKVLSSNDYTDDEKTKLKNIATGANKYTHPTTTGNRHIPAGGSEDQILRWESDGTAAWGDETVYVHPTTSGNKHIPSGGSSGKILKWSADGTAVWGDETSYTHPTNSGNKHIPEGGSSGQILIWSADGTAVWGDAPVSYTHPTASGYKHIPSGGSSGQILKWSSDGTAAWATEYSYTHPTTSGNKHIPSGGSSGQILKWSADGTAVWATEYSYTHPSTHAASMIVEDSTHRFVTDEEKETWNNAGGGGIQGATGVSAFVGNSGTVTIAHGLGEKPASVVVTPNADSAGTLGEFWVSFDETNIVVGNTGESTVAFSWLAILGGGK